MDGQLETRAYCDTKQNRAWVIAPVESVQVITSVASETGLARTATESPEV
jgi:hypothetical protein